MGRRGVWGGAVLLLLGSVTTPLLAQVRQVAGTVTSAKGPVAAATVTQVGGRASAVSNDQGRFTITLPEGEVRLSVRAIGFQRKEVGIAAGATSVSVELAEDVFKLEEVVTTGQATTLEKRSATTATVSVDKEEITRAPAQSLDQALQGKVLGATVTLNGGGPGGGGQIQIRGASSIIGNSQPLFVVDGTIISNDAFSGGLNTVTRAAGTASTSAQDNLVNRLSDLNPNEIESIEVLKSAAATAIYGSRATNGVIVIRTKRGAPGQTRLNVTQRVGTQEPLRLLGSRVFSRVSDVANIPYGNGGRGVPTNPATIYLNQAFPDGTIPLSANRDYQKEFYDNTSPSYETTASLTGGSETFKYFASLGNRQETGIAPNTGAKLQTLRFNIDQTWKNGFSAQLSANVTRNVLDRGVAGNDNTCTSPMYCIPYTPGVINLDSVDANGTFVRNPFNGGGNRVSNWFETFQFLKNTQDVFRSVGSANLSYRALEGDRNTVTLNLGGGLDRYQQEAYVFSPPFLQYEGGVDGLLGRVAQSSAEGLNYNAQFTAVWTHKTANDWTVTTSVGSSLERQGTNFYLTRARGTLPGVETIQQGVLDAIQSITQFNDQALFANTQLQAFKDRLSITTGLRADRSSANGSQSTFYVFPRASAAYRFDNPLPFVSSFKVRGGWGQTGNRPRYADRDVPGGAVLIAGNQGIIAPGTVGNPGIKPETLTEVEGGVDATLFGDRVQLEATYFQRNISDLLLNPALAPTSGFNALVINGGEMKTTGVELGLTWLAINSRDLQWTLRPTWQRNVQTVTNLPSFVAPFNPSAGNAASMRPRIVNGQRTTWAWANAPFDASGQFLPTGSVVVDPTRVRSTRDTIIGDINPDFQAFLSSQLQWKRLSFSFTLDWRQGGLVYNFTQRLFDEGGTSRDYETPMTAENAPAGTSAEVIAFANANNIGLGRFRYLAAGPTLDGRVYSQDGGYVRVRDIALSYDVPERAAKSLGARTMRLTLQGRNMFIFTKYWSFDPENNRQGNQNIRQAQDLAAFPGARQFFFSVDVGF
ncbi:MAG: SusC/RagA family TonB-linked outer membrane protein [Gemmatimonadales bacterium]|nr:SusC/RagA family TonB-linked outer membrane protein [Gemmatimonadales bacterium]